MTESNVGQVEGDEPYFPGIVDFVNRLLGVVSRGEAKQLRIYCDAAGRVVVERGEEKGWAPFLLDGGRLIFRSIGMSIRRLAGLELEGTHLIEIGELALRDTAMILQVVFNRDEIFILPKR